ncbi:MULTISPECIES: DUF6058 family natural product biosynthesis protein [Streptomyces]|uniref:DUF6058 family natural product biosynthesis protein n=1 Tax=Streptomyces edwardsiae TaxID=3075527 RepID=A0ABU2Q7G4_9ACTN|nr:MULTISPECIES: DUF6058 family natural product biosynthesis protein [unclassified Streptomyces]MDT0400367.1 DUF6058 family natural product biosynthesis protein [Streptomyces sp. DSM 41635]
MPETDLKHQLAERFREINGDHPMTDADDVYVSTQFVALEELCAVHGRVADAVRHLMLGQHLPLPGYLRSDGAEMVPADLFALADEAGGVEQLETWFTAHWADPATGKAEWNAYLSGQYVCLHSVTPATIQRKEYLTATISAAANEPDAGSAQWSEQLHAVVDELDTLEPAFTAYDRLRFGGPTSRDTCIDAMRARFPRP